MLNFNLNFASFKNEIVMLRLKLPILYNTELSQQKESLGLRVDEKEDYQYRDVIFYRIDAVGDNTVEGVLTGGSVINSCGELYICSLSKEEVDVLILSQTNQSL